MMLLTAWAKCKGERRPGMPLSSPEPLAAHPRLAGPRALPPRRRLCARLRLAQQVRAHDPRVCAVGRQRLLRQHLAGLDGQAGAGMARDDAVSTTPSSPASITAVHAHASAVAGPQGSRARPAPTAPAHRVEAGQLLQPVGRVELPLAVHVVAGGLWRQQERRADKCPAVGQAGRQAGNADRSLQPQPWAWPRPSAHLERGRRGGSAAKGHKRVQRLLAQLNQRGVRARAHMHHLRGELQGVLGRFARQSLGWAQPASLRWHACAQHRPRHAPEGCPPLDTPLAAAAGRAACAAPPLPRAHASVCCRGRAGQGVTGQTDGNGSGCMACSAMPEHAAKSKPAWLTACPLLWPAAG